KFDADASLVTYRINGTGPDGKPFEERAGSIWANRGGKWMAVFHHGTPVMQMPSRYCNKVGMGKKSAARALT
ncbi:MAG TPA: hypothetical protein VGA87_00260, partial [Pyrinomonadaceae bacterium]